MIDYVPNFREPRGKPGEIADADGAIWLPYCLKVSYGEVSVTTGQAGAAEMFGWTIIDGSDLLGRVLIRRSPPAGYRW